MVSNAATGADLSDKDAYKYFSRIVPPDTIASKALTRFIENFDWHRQLVILQDTDGAYSRDMARHMVMNFQDLAIRSGKAQEIIHEGLPVPPFLCEARDIEDVLLYNRSKIRAAARRIPALRPQPRIFVAPLQADTMSIVVPVFRKFGFVSDATVWIVGNVFCKNRDPFVVHAAKHLCLHALQSLC